MVASCYGKHLVDYQILFDKSKFVFRTLDLPRSNLLRRRANARRESFSQTLLRLSYLQLQFDNQRFTCLPKRHNIFLQTDHFMLGKSGKLGFSAQSRCISTQINMIK